MKTRGKTRADSGGSCQAKAEQIIQVNTSVKTEAKTEVKTEAKTEPVNEAQAEAQDIESELPKRKTIEISDDTDVDKLVDELTWSRSNRVSGWNSRFNH